MITRSLIGKVDESVRRTIVELGAQVDSLRSELTALKAVSNGNARLSPIQLQQIAGLIGARAQSLIGQDTPDPVLAQFGNGTVTSFSAGNLSPLFTTSVATPTTTPAESFAQIAQNANLFYAGPASGGPANPTFRLPVAADLAGLAAPLLSSTTMNLDTSTKQTLYTVPAGKSCLPLWIVGRSASVDLSGGATTNLDFGFNAGSNDWALGNFGTAAFTSSSLFLMLTQTDGLAGFPSVIGTAAQTFGAKCDVAFGSAATLVLDLFGYEL